MDELENLKQQLEELKRLRSELSVKEEKQEENTDVIEAIRAELPIIDEQIKELELEVKKTAKEYEESYKRLQSIIDDYNEKTEATKLLSEEELQELKEHTEQLKLEENKRSNEIKNRLEAQKKLIRSLKTKRNQLEKNINKAEALGLTLAEYKEITAAMRKTSIMNAILEKKGLIEIIEKPAKERTKEEKDALKKAKEEILEEISKAKKENKEESVLDMISALYSLDLTVKKGEVPRDIPMSEEKIKKLEENSQTLPFRIVNNATATPTYKPQETPKDMENVGENEKVDINELKPAEERVTVFKDVETNDYYARKYAVDRFELTTADLANEVRINGSLCYKISEEDVEKIKENANNVLSPYTTDIKEISLENEKTKVDTNTISDEDTKDELIPGTNIKRPRDRKVHETDEEYEAFLKSYYDKVFPQNTETQEKTYQEDKNERVTVFKDTKSGNYYVRKYAVERFKLKTAELTNEVRINGSLCYKIELSDVDKLSSNADNELSPYMVNIKEISLEEEKTPVVEQKEDKEELSEDDIKEIFDESLDEIKEEKEEQEEISEDDIKAVVEEELNKDKEDTTEETKKEEPKEDKKDEKLKASNVKASDEFKKELKTGGVLYNIVHAVPKIGKVIVKTVKKIFGKSPKEEEIDKMIEEYDNAQPEETTAKARK